MNNKTLVENQFGHGGKKTNFIVRKIRRWRRGKYDKYRKSLVSGSSPYDWSIPYASPHSSVKNQMSSFSCGGMAGSYLLAIVRFLGGLVTTMEELSAKSIYAPIAYPGGGTTQQDLETQLCVHGANLESQVPDINNGTCTESFMSEKSWITSDISEDAIKRAGYTPLSVSIDMDSIAEAIRNEGGVIMIVQGKNAEGDGWFAPYPTPPSKSNPNPIWEHFVCGFGTQAPLNVKQIDFLQSWGITVGDRGIQHFREDYINSGYIVDCFTIVRDDKLTPVPTQGLNVVQLMYQSVCLWFKRQSWFQ